MGERFLTVLVVDDCPDMVATCRELLELEGYDVRTALCGDEMRTALEGWEPDVILLDLMMPGEDGLSLARQLGARGLERPLLVAVTGMASDLWQQRAREAGFDHFLVKPVEPGELMRLLRICTSRLEAPTEPLHRA
jgi:CheY-like chemotaxis protein